jgi:hypothetical protein
MGGSPGTVGQGDSRIACHLRLAGRLAPCPAGCGYTRGGLTGNTESANDAERMLSRVEQTGGLKSSHGRAIGGRAESTAWH